MGVFPSFSKYDMNHGQGQRVQFRILGRPIGNQDDECGLGDRGYDSEGCIRYILETKMHSSDPQDRIWFIQTLWTERYAGHLTDVEALTRDADPSVRETARKRLDLVTPHAFGAMLWRPIFEVGDLETFINNWVVRRSTS
jgi:hypothetical protein